MGELVVVGLGNPGAKYANSRHNAGADCVEQLSARHDVRLREDRKVAARIAPAAIGGVRVHLAVPTTYMNESGRAVGAVLRRHPIEAWDRLVVVHDELDLPLGVVKVKLGGGLAGHNGLRSVEQVTGTRDWARVRIGVGKPAGGPEGGAGWVLSGVPASARAELDDAVLRAADAVEQIAAEGIDAAMQVHNARRRDPD